MTGSTFDDRQLANLMQAAQGGNADAYVKLLEEIAPRIRQIIRCQRRFLEAGDIEDLVQDVLLSVHAVRATYDPQRPFMPWLLAITRNRLADGARCYARGAAHEIYVEALAVTFPDESTNTTMEAFADSHALEEAIAALPSMQRNAIQMLKLREMSLKETAAACNTTVGALKVATHRAMASLRKMLVKKR